MIEHTPPLRVVQRHEGGWLIYTAYNVDGVSIDRLIGLVLLEGRKYRPLRLVGGEDGSEAVMFLGGPAAPFDRLAVAARALCRPPVEDAVHITAAHEECIAEAAERLLRRIEEPTVVATAYRALPKLLELIRQSGFRRGGVYAFREEVGDGSAVVLGVVGEEVAVMCRARDGTSSPQIREPIVMPDAVVSESSHG